MNLKISNRDNPLPFYVCFGKNEYFFAKMQWLLYKKLNKMRSIPCGRTKKDKFLCCCQPLDKEHCYLSSDKHGAYCKCCGHIKFTSNKKIDLNNIGEW